MFRFSAAAMLLAFAPLAQASDDAVPITVDLGILFDRSASFNDDIATFRSVSRQMTSNLSAQVDDLAVGLSSFVDAPCNGFGSSGEFGFSLDMSLTRDLSVLEHTLANLNAFDGLDYPESQLEAMVQALTGKGLTVNRGHASCRGVADIASSDMGWRKRSLKFLFVSTDSEFHTPLSAGYPYPSTADDVIAAANALGVSVYFLYAGDEVDPNAVKIAEATDGEVRKLATNSAGIDQVIESLVMEKVRKVSGN